MTIIDDSTIIEGLRAGMDNERIVVAIETALSELPVPLPAGMQLVFVDQTGEHRADVIMMRTTWRGDVQALTDDGRWLTIGERLDGVRLRLARSGASDA